MRFVRIASAASIPSMTGPTIQKRASAHPRGEHCLRDHRTGRVAILRELPAPSSGDFGWGYNGSGLNWAAKAVLADALKLSDPGRIGIGPGREDSTLSLLRQDFCWTSRRSYATNGECAADPCCGGSVAGTPNTASPTFLPPLFSRRLPIRVARRPSSKYCAVMRTQLSKPRPDRALRSCCVGHPCAADWRQSNLI